MKTLVLAPAKQRTHPLLRMFENDIRLGWRITCQDGEPYDLLWGATPPEKLDASIAAVRGKHGEVELLDIREKPEELRDYDYYDRQARLG